MATPIVENLGKDVSIASVWGILILLSCISTAICYGLLALFIYRKLVALKVSLLVLAPFYSIVGALHAFFYLSPICLSIGCILKVYGQGMSILDAVMFSCIMTFVIIFIATARKSHLYAF
ncbi:unnamed protein product [Phytomonas sp. EM1]|nr:unnamed protein product [Phytomonas sp. EM1]|eukprot:CCW59896.1 unnamed protein product [Phytomonas sp. isolate EM1]